MITITTGARFDCSECGHSSVYLANEGQVAFQGVWQCPNCGCGMAEKLTVGTKTDLAPKSRIELGGRF